MDTTIDYNLNIESKGSNRKALSKMLQFMKGEKRNLLIAFLVMLLNAVITMLTPYLIGYAIDHYIQTGQLNGLMLFSGLVLLCYLIWTGTEYLQTKVMGSVGQRMLYALRNEVFHKLQQLPVAFFNQNKSGDLISRINNDTDKVNQFFSQSLLRFADSIFMMAGAAVFILSINPSLGAASLIPAVFILVFVLLVSPWVKKKNATGLKATGGLSAEVQESMHNFKTIIAFNRRDYFRHRFDEANRQNYRASIIAGLANGIFTPVFSFLSNLAQLIVLAFGIYLISKGQFTIGLLISFIAYVQNFYQPLRQLAELWAGYQTAMAAWDRISVILSLKSNMQQLPETAVAVSNVAQDSVIRFEDVSFQYPGGRSVLHHISFDLKRGKTYALVGPTGGGKTTTASLIARLYDPTEGKVLLYNRDIRSYSDAERSQLIGFILQDPFLFTGTLRENILYGNEAIGDVSSEALEDMMRAAGLGPLLMRFEKGLDTELRASADGLSLGQKQLIAFIRAILRKPKILILDEATANIDTVTEQLLEDILQQLPPETTRIIIAHRLNTIENADEIFFVNSGAVIPAGNLEHALAMLLSGKKAS